MMLFLKFFQNFAWENDIRAKILRFKSETRVFVSQKTVKIKC